MLGKSIALPALALAAFTAGAQAYTIEPSQVATAPSAVSVSPAAVVQPATQIEEQVLLVDQPVTVNLTDADGTVLRTRLSGLNLGSGAPFIRVFVNAPDADAEATSEDSAYAGAIAFYPVPIDGNFTSVLNVARFAPVTWVTYVMSGDAGARVIVEAADLTDP